MAGRLGERLSVYYCIDDYASLPDVNSQAVRAMDEELTRRADRVFIASETLRVSKTLLNNKTHVSPHGVDVDHFARARDARTVIPPEMAILPRPIIGFFGLIEQWIDLDLIDEIAARRPEWSIVLIGRMAVPDHPVCHRPNVHLLGKRLYEDLPAFGKAFDAAIIPYRLTQQVLHANPIKLREYLAMGKPVVSVSTPEIDKYADVVEIADTREEFLAKLDAVLSRPSTSAEIERRVGRVAMESWDARLATVLEIVRQDLAGKGSPRAAGVGPGIAVSIRTPSGVCSMISEVYLRPANRSNPLPTVRELLELCRWRDLVPSDASVVIKPNLCTERPEQIHTANTSIGVLRAVCEVLREQTPRITIVESDGARYPAEAAFENNGVYALAAELGLQVLNLSKDELVEMPDPRLKGFGMARTWLEADVFVSLPALKTHATTVFTGTLKNQWGCIPRYDRILLHKYLHELIGQINAIRPVTLALMDGLVGMQGRGPINGYPINMDVLLASRDPVALDATAMRLIGLKPAISRHVVHAERLGLGRLSEEQIAVDGPFAELCTTVEPAVEDWAIKIMNQVARSPFITKHFLLNDYFFYPVRRVVGLARQVATYRARRVTTG